MLCSKGNFLPLGQAFFFCVGKDEFFSAHAKMKVGACLFLHEVWQYLANYEQSVVFILQNLAA